MRKKRTVRNRSMIFAVFVCLAAITLCGIYLLNYTQTMQILIQNLNGIYSSWGKGDGGANTTSAYPSVEGKGVIITLSDKEMKDNNSQPDTLVLVNKANALPAEYVPVDLVEPQVKRIGSITSDEKKMRKEAAKALEQLFEAALKEGIQLYCVSGYRSYETQKLLYEHIKTTHGIDFATKYSAQPGQSEHQTGLAMDITNISYYDEENDMNLGKTKEGKWLKDNVHRFGFILRYPEGKSNITGYSYEPWHFRYVGTEAAIEIFSKDMILEEYMEALSESGKNAGRVNAEDIINLVRSLQEAGAAAIAVNDERIVNKTEIRPVPANHRIEINGKAHAAPFVVKAIGDADRIYAAMTDKKEGFISRLSVLKTMKVEKWEKLSIQGVN